MHVSHPLADVSFNSRRILDVADPVGATDVANKQYVDGTIGGNANVDTATISGLTGGGDLTADRTFDIGAGGGIAVNADDIAVDIPSVADFSDTVAAGDTILMYDTSATTMLEISRSAFVLSESEVDTMIATMALRPVLLEGSQAMTGNMDLGSQRITNLADPAAAQDVATRNYLDTEISNDVSGLSTDSIIDADNHTQIQVEETGNEDVIRFDTAGSERMVIDASGNVGIVTDAPAVELDVVGDIEYTGTLTDVSDRRLKHDIMPLEDSLDKILAIQGGSFVMKGDGERRKEIGWITQQVEEVMPELVETADDEMQTKSVNYIGFIGYITEAIHELHDLVMEKFAQQDRAIANLQNSSDQNSGEIAELNAENAELKAELTAVQ